MGLRSGLDYIALPLPTLKSDVINGRSLWVKNIDVFFTLQNDLHYNKVIFISILIWKLINEDFRENRKREPEKKTF